MDWFKKHADAVAVIATIICSMLWMNGKFSDIDKRFSELEKDLAVVKAVLIMKNILPLELAHKEETGP